MPVKNRLRRDNLLRILESLWLYPNRSRADLARELRLDRSTVGVIIDKMIELGILNQHADDYSGPKGGRPPILLSIVSGFAYCIGVELTYPHIRLNAVDLSGKFLGSRDIPIKTYGPQSINTLAVETARFRASLDSSFIGGPGLVTIGIGVSGVVDDLKKEIILSDALHISTPLSIANPLETVLKVPISLLNDAQASVLREAGLRRKQELLLIQVEFRSVGSMKDIGIGVGLVIRNQLIQGRSIRHLLGPEKSKKSESKEQFIEKLGHSLALVANVTGTDEIVLGGGEEILELLEQSLLHHSTREGISLNDTLSVSRAAGGSDAVASGAAYAALKFLFASLSFPLHLPVTNQ
jgi:predicted NBD/HSP70 family sugar kinase